MLLWEPEALDWNRHLQHPFRLPKWIALQLQKTRLSNVWSCRPSYSSFPLLGRSLREVVFSSTVVCFRREVDEVEICNRRRLFRIVTVKANFYGFP